MNADEKTCPFCGETIKAVAVFCRFCNHDLPLTVAHSTAVASSASPAPPPNSLEAGHVLDLLTHLVDKNLVVYEEDANGNGRYRLLETIRQYSRDRLTESSEGEAGRQRHLTHFLSLAEQAARHIYGAGQAAWQKRLEPEHDNLRAAFEWSLTRQEGAEAALRLVGALVDFWIIGSHLREGMTWATRALAGDRSAPPLVLARATSAGWSCAFHCAPERARSLAEAALQYAREAQDRWTIANALFGAAIDAVFRGELEQATAHAEEGIALAEEAGDRWLKGRHLVVFALAAWMRGDYSASRRFFEESLEIARQFGGEWNIAMILANLGFVTRGDGDCDEARALHREGLSLCQRLGDRRGIGWNLVGMAGAEASQGRGERAARLLGAATAVLEATGAHLPPPFQMDHDQTVEQTQALLGEGTFAAFFAQGRAMTLEQAVAYALDEEPTP